MVSNPFSIKEKRRLLTEKPSRAQLSPLGLLLYDLRLDSNSVHSKGNWASC